MKHFIFLAVLLLGLQINSAHAQELLSAQDDRLGRMIESCRSDLKLSKRQCTCIFTNALDTNLSNVDLTSYFTNNHDDLSEEKLKTANELKEKCAGVSVSPPGKPDDKEGNDSGKDGKSDPVSKHTARCEQRSGMDKKRCACFLQNAANKKYADNDIEMFLKGKASKMSEFSLYTDMSIALLNCEKEAVQKEVQKTYVPPHGGGGNVSGVLKPYAGAKHYTANETDSFLFSCPYNRQRDSSFCACLAEKNWRYMPFWQFQSIKSSFWTTFSSVPNFEAKLAFFNKTKKQCEATYTGKIWTKEEAHDWFSKVRKKHNDSIIRRGEPLR